MNSNPPIKPCERVRYIHPNLLRARLAKDLNRPERYPFCGHGVIMGKFDLEWQENREIQNVVAQGIEQGKRADLTGGGLLKSTGSWAAVKAMRKAKIHIKSDERILDESEESVERRYELQARAVHTTKSCPIHMTAVFASQLMGGAWVGRVSMRHGDR